MTADYKLTLPPQSLETAEPAAKLILERAQREGGFIPNMYAGMANLPPLLETYLDGAGRFRREAGFSPVEQEVVFLTISRINGCEYCMSAHSLIADAKSKVPPAVTEALRNAAPVPDPKLAALSTFTETMVASRGLPSKTDVQAFLGAGYEERHVLGIVLAIAVKTLSNYANHLLHTPLDSMFASREWKKSA